MNLDGCDTKLLEDWDSKNIDKYNYRTGSLIASSEIPAFIFKSVAMSPADSKQFHQADMARPNQSPSMCESIIDKMAKGWQLAQEYSKKRLLAADNRNEMDPESKFDECLLLETLCLFLHACIKPGQHEVPSDFWRLMHKEFGILVYPSALTEVIAPSGLGPGQTFTEAYSDHIIVMHGKSALLQPFPSPFQLLFEPPPPYSEKSADDTQRLEELRPQESTF
ncbi:hypothetical protein B0I35DRAFT_259510 [Stachybotrys elegans]|uniref:Uncharacterized protein n=1 Tax=Stachybotrys elegans TaxID=80388 RepID=A0A8K0SK63_9HYPO|nr:hypothetical protein B0I35DRAFT_259510 [Stachybotrys elegans]